MTTRPEASAYRYGPRTTRPLCATCPHHHGAITALLTSRVTQYRRLSPSFSPHLRTLLLPIASTNPLLSSNLCSSTLVLSSASVWCSPFFQHHVGG